MILTKLYNRHFKKPLKLYWWRYNPPNQLNFGDEITPLIIKEVFGRQCTWTNPKECEIVGVGSIIEILQRQSKGKDINVWGSGFINEGDKNKLQNLHFFAVRGKLSLDRVNGEKIVLGDPGLLASYLLNSQPRKKYRLGIVPHYVDLDSRVVKELSKQKGVKIINPLSAPKEVTHDIAASECIVSSSLHGLIVADSVGTPNAHLKLSDGLTGGLYKFKDYYSVFPGPSRHVLLRPNDVSNKNAGIIAQKTSQLYKKPDNLDSLKQSLIKSFPY